MAIRRAMIQPMPVHPRNRLNRKMPVVLWVWRAAASREGKK
jgi:hypothetical protein